MHLARPQRTDSCRNVTFPRGPRGWSSSSRPSLVTRSPRAKIIRRLRSYSSRARTWRINSRSRGILCTIVPKTVARLQSGSARGSPQPQRNRPPVGSGPAFVNEGPSEGWCHPPGVSFTQVHEVGVLLGKEIGDQELPRSVPDADRGRRRFLAPHLGARAHGQKRRLHPCYSQACTFISVLGSSSAT